MIYSIERTKFGYDENERKKLSTVAQTYLY